MTRIQGKVVNLNCLKLVMFPNTIVPSPFLMTQRYSSFELDLQNEVEVEVAKEGVEVEKPEFEGVVEGSKKAGDNDKIVERLEQKDIIIEQLSIEGKFSRGS